MTKKIDETAKSEVFDAAALAAGLRDGESESLAAARCETPPPPAIRWVNRYTARIRSAGNRVLHQHGFGQEFRVATALGAEGIEVIVISKKDNRSTFKTLLKHVSDGQAAKKVGG